MAGCMIILADVGMRITTLQDLRGCSQIYWCLGCWLPQFAHLVTFTIVTRMGLGQPRLTSAYNAKTKPHVSMR